MKLRLVTILGCIATFVLALLLAFGAPSPGLADDSIPTTDPIAQGLCVGASLDLGLQSQVECARQVQTAANQPPAQPPDIWTGLCVGASLNISAASAASCARQSTSARTRVSASTAATTHTAPRPAPHPKTEQPAPQPEPQPTPSTPSASYVAMGDSVAAGLGLTGSRGTTCGRSTEAYAYDVAASRGLSLNLVACRGATARSISRASSAQMTAAFASGTPQLITITAGANDVSWDRFLRKCYATTCGTTTDEHLTAALLARLEHRFTKLLTNIEEKSQGSPPEVIVTGYYDPLSDACAQAEPRVTADEIAWLSRQTESLNQSIEDSTNQFSFARFVPIDFSGHDLCSSDSWVQGLNDPSPFHPTAAGQQAIAQAIL